MVSLDISSYPLNGVMVLTLSFFLYIYFEGLLQCVNVSMD